MKPIPSSETSIDARIDARIDEILSDQAADVWEIVREEASEALARDPKDEVAQSQMLAYEQWARQQAVPDAIKARKSGLVLAKKSVKPEGRTGVWKMSPTERCHVVFVTKSKVGDVVIVRSTSGKTQRVRLTEQLSRNEYRGIGI